MQHDVTWVDVPAGSPFPLANLPYGSFSVGGEGEAVHAEGPRRRVGVAIGNQVLDLGGAAQGTGSPFTHLLDGPVVNPLMAAGAATWAEVRATVTEWLSDVRYRDAIGRHLFPCQDVTLHLPFEVGDYVDFYSSEHHAVNAGRILRPMGEPLTPNWKYLPVGYHGRAGTIAVSGTPVKRPPGQVREPGGTAPSFRPTQALDFEAELGFVVGPPSDLGCSVPLSAFEDHVFGVVILCDWSARDIQAWEYAPLGPFLGKSFLTSISPWLVPLAALRAARTDPPPRDPPLLAYLDDSDHRWGLDITLEVEMNGHVISRPPFSSMYWTAAQQLAHMTSNGASLRTGDLYGSGTISGPRPDEVGSLLELSWGGSRPFETSDGSVHTYLQDGDEVVITAAAPAVGGGTLGFGGVQGRVVGSGSP